MSTSNGCLKFENAKKTKNKKNAQNKRLRFQLNIKRIQIAFFCDGKIPAN